jgi:hypothetical protein
MLEINQGYTMMHGQPIIKKYIHCPHLQIFMRVRKIAESNYELHVRPSFRMEQRNSQMDGFL